MRHGHGGDIVTKVTGSLTTLDHRDELFAPAAGDVERVGPEFVIAQGGPPELDPESPCMAGGAGVLRHAYRDQSDHLLPWRLASLVELAVQECDLFSADVS